MVVAVLSYDGRHLLETLLPSLAAQRYRDFAVAVVDNGSSDGTEAWLAATWPEVQCVVLPENVGVTRALNECVRATGASELVMLLNNDMELDPDCVGRLVDALGADAAAGSAAPKLLDFHRRDVFDGAGDQFEWSGQGGRRGHGEVDRGQYDRPEHVFGACGGAALYRRSAFELVGLFDERFFAFYEDVDWNLRAQLAGLRCVYVPSAVAYHMGSATLGRGMTDFLRHQLVRNGLWVLLKDVPLGMMARHPRIVVRAHGGGLIDALRSGQGATWLRAFGAALRGLGGVLRSRRRVQRSRVVTLAELERAVRGG